LDVHGQSTTINALNGNGTVDNLQSGSPTGLTIGGNNDNGTFNGVIQNTGAGLGLTKTGGGIEVLTGTNTFYGLLTVSQGTLALTQELSLYNGRGAITLGGGSGLPTLQFLGSHDEVGSSRPINLAGNAALDASGTSSGDNFTSTQGGELAGTLNLGSGSLTKTGPGLWALDAANTMAGVTINNGTLLVTTAVNLGAATAPLAFSGSGAMLDIEKPNPPNLVAAYSDARPITLEANGTILQDNTLGATLSGVISGSGDLLKTGPGNLILSGSTNNFGGTLVEAGYLTVTSEGAIPNEALSIAAGGTFVFDPDAAQNSDSLSAGFEGDSPILVEQKSGQSPRGLAAVPEPGTLALLAAALWSAAGHHVLMVGRRFSKRAENRPGGSKG
jgi:autotransporter-associated beta strand protein